MSDDTLSQTAIYLLSSSMQKIFCYLRQPMKATAQKWRLLPPIGHDPT